MKNIKLFTLLFSFIIINLCFAQGGWFWQNPLPHGNNQNIIQALNKDTIIIGGRGKIYTTQNGGLNWIIFNTGINAEFRASNYIDNNTGWIVGDSGMCFKTTNSGTNWQKKEFIIGSNPKYLTSIKFLDQQTGWITGGNFPNGGIYKTTNGGVNWNFIPQPGFGVIYSIFFYDYNTGWMGSNSGVLKTTNSGVNWIISYPWGYGGDIYFLNSTTGWLSVKDTISRTINGGLNWVKLNTNQLSRKMYYLSIDTGYILNNYLGVNRILRTINSGITWNSIYNGNNLTDFCAINYFDLFCTGKNGFLVKTTNAGQNWDEISSGFRTDKLSNIFFIDENSGFSSGYQNLYKTTDGGISWNLKLVTSSCDFNNINLLFDNTLWAVQGIGSFGRIFKSSNNGENWTLLLEDLKEFNNIQFLNNTTGFVCGAKSQSVSKWGVMLKTTNGGNNWFNNYEFYYQLNMSFNDIYIISENLIYSCGNKGYFFKTTDTGLSWEPVNLGINEDFVKIVFVHENGNNYYGWLLSNKSVYKSINSGSTWQQVYHTNDGPYNSSIFFTSLVNGFIGMENGNMLYTTNGGLNWILKRLDVESSILDIFFISNNTGWAVGDGGIVIKTTNGGGVIGINYLSEYLANNYSLSQNYPNPFNPQTKIKFDIPENVNSQTSNVKLVIYDLLGREVTTLINEELKPGTYEADWDGSDYSSGVYFYKIISGDFVETKKMVLMK